MSTYDAPLQALLLPFSNGLLPWFDNQPILFLRARDGAALRQFNLNNLVCEQSFKPFADSLIQAGLSVEAEINTEQKFNTVLVLLPRQREEARALLARAVLLTAKGGRIVASLANNEGAKSGESDLQQLTGLGGKTTKFHCRVFWSPPLNDEYNQELLNQWLAFDKPRPIKNNSLLSRSGLFSWDRIDPASQLLINSIPSTLKGEGADLGAGFGYLGYELLSKNSGITLFDHYEAEYRALSLIEKNLAQFTQCNMNYYWQDVMRGLSKQYDFIVSNPPFHTPSRADRPDIGQQFIRIAASALKPNGRLYLVANRHLPYENILNTNFGQVQVLNEHDGFKVIEAIKSNKNS